MAEVSDIGRKLLGLFLSPFLNIGTTIASFQISGTFPFDSDKLNSLHRGIDKLEAHFF